MYSKQRQNKYKVVIIRLHFYSFQKQLKLA